MTTTFNLLHCPFCGADAFLEVLEDHHGEYFNLGCSDTDCFAHWAFYTVLPEELLVEEAVAAWNRRV